MKSRKAALVMFVFAIVAVLFLVPLFAQGVQIGRNPGLPIVGTVADFFLQDSHSEEFTRGRLDGKIWVADFIVASGPEVCEVMTGKMAALYRKYLGESDVHFVSISVDPDSDTPEVLARYAEAHGADTSRWHFLTGARDMVQKLAAQGFKLGPIDNLRDCSTPFVLVDRRGRIRGYYDSADEPAIGRLSEDIASLLDERRL